MKTFTRRRTIDELNAAVESHGWTLDTRLLHLGESDFVNFRFTIGDVSGLCLVSTFNGRFLGTLDGDPPQPFSSDEPRDSEPWFATLLDVAYDQNPR